MATMVEISGHTYRIGRLNARQQLHVARKLTPTPISALIGAASSGSVVMSDVARERAIAAGVNLDDMQNMLPKLLPSLSLRSLSMLPQTDCDFVIDTCMGVCARRETDGRWVAVWNAGAGQMQFQDIELEIMLELTVEVLKENLGNFFGESLALSQSQMTSP